MKKFILLLFIIMLVGCKNTNNEYQSELKQEISNLETEEITKLTEDDYKNNNVNELGEVPIMMYHGIHDISNNETNFTGGNVDKDGYQRTSESFIYDLEFYYNEGYRMIRLTDYIDGNIDVELGKSPIVLTFDDGSQNNIKVIGLDQKGNIIIDPNSAVGILESFKTKYPDFNVTATFFLNGELFNQPEYNEKILKWLVENNYDIGNHTYSHVNFSEVDKLKTQNEVGKLYSELDKIIPNKYVNIIALPFGSPYDLEHINMNYILNTNYNNKKYTTKSTLRVGWKSEYSPFHINFNSKFIKRIRAYDNEGKEFDIKMNFSLLEKSRYISDGNINTIVVKRENENLLGNNYNKEIIIY